LTEDGVLPLAVCELLCDGLPQAGSLDQALSLLDRARVLVLGAGMLTVNLDVTTAQDPPQADAYPVGGGKTKTRTPWTRQLLEQGQVFIGEGDAALAQVFDDHARIASLSLHSVVNVPLLRDGRCVATFNVLGSRPAWTAGEVAAIRMLALLAAPHVFSYQP
jgi:GAF domain-containing protein